MKSILVATSAEKEVVKQLAEKSLPAYRQAYSDRTSWLMACMSELTYLRFNPFVLSDELISKIANFLDESHKEKFLSLMSAYSYDHEEERKTLEQDLFYLGGYRIVETFDREGTQAILVRNEKHLVLAFRGTEASIKDIKADISAINSLFSEFLRNFIVRNGVSL